MEESKGRCHSHKRNRVRKRPMERGRHKMVENVDQDGKPLGTFYCATCRSRSFDHLSKQERAVVGDPEDYEWEKA